MPDDLTALFTQRAETVSAVVRRFPDRAAALAHAVSIAAGRPPQKPLLPTPVPPAGVTLACPGLPPEDLGIVAPLAAERGVTLVTGGLRNHLAGVDVGLTIADYGIAETGTLVIDSTDEEVRLATEIVEAHVVLLPEETIRAAVADLAPALSAGFATPRFWAFVTGASRTADIERVLAIGVHGPVELHILIVDAEGVHKELS